MMTEFLNHEIALLDSYLMGPSTIKMFNHVKTILGFVVTAVGEGQMVASMAGKKADDVIIMQLEVWKS